MNAFQTIVLSKDRKYKEYFFTLYSGQDEISVNSDDLHYFGIAVEYINHCTVKLKDGDKSRLVHCSPKIIKKPVVQNDQQTSLI